MDKVSVIVPVYNVERYLRRCLDSIKKQTYSNIEVIVVDDGSTDSSGSICEEYVTDQRFQIYHQENKGLSRTRNFALDHINGDYIVFVDSDDYIDPYLIEKSLAEIKRYNLDVLIFGNYIIEDDGIKEFRNEFEKEHIDIDKLGTEDIYRLILLDKILNVMWNKVYKRCLWDSIRFPVDYNYEDLFIQPSLLGQAKHIKYLSEHLYYNNRINQNSLTSNINDYNAWNRYSKFKAYREHEKVASLLNDEKMIMWAKYQAVHESIKVTYINYNSIRKLTREEKEEVLSYLKKNPCNFGDYRLSKKYKFLRWSALYFPVFSRLYGNIRYLQERIKNK